MTFVALALELLSGVTACSSDTPIDTRSRPSANLLPEGDVLVAGGSQDEKFLGVSQTRVLASAERYHPKTGTWTPTGSMEHGRYGHTATSLPDGRVLVAGGFSKGTSISQTSSAELYDPKRGSWSSTGAMTQARVGHRATLLMDGRVLVTGGESEAGVSATTEVYDPATGRWSALASMGTARTGHSATVLPDGKVLVSGGVDASIIHLTRAEVYDPEGNTWSPTGSMADSRAGHVATLLPNGKVLVTGGGSYSTYAEVYDPVAGTWASAGIRPGNSLEYHTATALSDGSVLVVGGYGPQGLLDTVEVYSPETNSWSPRSPLPEPRGWHSAILLRDGRVLVVGGSTRGNGASVPLETAAIYDPGTDTWK